MEKIEAPKVQHNVKDMVTPYQELLGLAHAVFDQTEAGKRFLKLLKDFYVSDKNSAVVFPVALPNIQKFGGSMEAYAGYKSGQTNVVFQIEGWIESFKKAQANLVKPKE